MKTKLLLLFSLAIISLSANAFTVISVTGAGVGGWGTDTDMVTTDGINYTLSNLHITGSGPSAELKFREAHDWAVAYGYETGTTGWPSGTGLASGLVSNIPGVAGFWNVTFNLTTKAFSFTLGVNPNAEIKLIGTATSPSGFTFVTTDGISYSIKSATFNVGNAKFAETGTSNQWSTASFPNGTGTQSGATIAIPGGTYNITFNKSTGEYAFLPTVVNMIGVGSPSASWSSDAVMSTTDAITYTLNNATITGGTMKFRDNADWTFQYGATDTANTPFPSGTAVDHGNDMTTQSGTYNITFNRTTLAYNFQNALNNNSFNISTFKVYPNPTNSNWNFSSTNEEITSIKIIDVLGKIVLSKSASSTEVLLDASSLNNGVYFAKINSIKGVETVKLVKN
ncbi:T9SS type A sorting domain-containing protein [Flavobacterium sp.]|uniref:T9SS type A sorting domain-containing protein n=1 Tax=Flavobacterium sp. TaxID=239 RepID=UPI00375023D3